MFRKLFGLKSKEEATSCNTLAGSTGSNKVPEASKGYHSCVSTCEQDIENLETECDGLRRDNEVLIAKLASLQVNEKKGQEASDASLKQILELSKQVEERDERIAELEQRLVEADEKADGTPVKYASARKALTKAKLKQLRTALEAAPNGAGFGGSCSVYDKKTKRVSLVEFKSKADALAILDKADKGNVDIIM